MSPSGFVMPRNISFRVETLFTGNKNRVGRIPPDENGIYNGLPMMVMGEVTQQKTFYEPQSMVNQITNPDTSFNKKLKQGKLYGELGHPNFHGLTDSEKMQRLMTVEEKTTSHLITGVFTDSPNSEGNVVVRANLKPSGPYGAVFKESLDDPVVNTAFSLRAYVDTRQRPDGVKFRNVRQLVTWDTVGASGYATTDKAHALGLESFSGDQYNEYEIMVMDNGNLLIDQIALESFTDTDLNEIFGSRQISKIIQTRTMIETDISMDQRFPSVYRESIFQDFFREG